MNPPDSEEPDDRIGDLLAAYHEALLGSAHAISTREAIPPSVQAKLAGFQSVLSRIESDRRRSLPSPESKAPSRSLGLTRVGRYQLIRQIGRGAYGIVFL